MRRVCRRTSSSQAEPSPWRHCWTSWASCSKLSFAPFSRFLHLRLPQVTSLGLPYNGTQIALGMFPCSQGCNPPIGGILLTPAPPDKTRQFNRLCALDAALPPPVLFTLMGATSRKWWFLGLGAVLLGFLLYHFRAHHLFHLSQFSGVKLWHAIRGANYAYLLLSVVAIYLCYAIRAWRWQKFQTHVGQARFWNIYAMNLAGFSALFLLGRAAEPLRPVLISRKDKIPLADTFGIYALERILDAASTAVLAAIGLLVFESSGHSSAQGAQAFEKGARTVGIAFSLFTLIAICLLVYLRLHGTAVLVRRMQGWLAAHGWRAVFARIVLGFSRGVQTVRTWGDLVAAIFLSAIHWGLVVAVYFLVIKSFGGKLGMLTFSDAMLVLVFTMVGSAVQLPGVGGGAQALSIVAFTHLYGVEQEAAVAAVMVLWLVTFASCTLAGVPILFREGWSLGDLRRMSQHEDEQIDAEIAAR